MTALNMANPQFTMRKLADNGVIKKGNLYRIPVDLLSLDHTYNIGRQYNDPAELRAHIDQFKVAILAGANIPLIEVWVHPHTGVCEVTEGFCRTTAYQELKAEGKLANDMIDCIPFVGDLAQRRARTINSNNQLKLTKIGEAMVIQQMRDIDGMSNQEIAEAIGRSAGHVNQMLLLADGGAEIHKAVAAGDVSSTEAVKLVREFKEGAPKELERRKEIAAQNGKDKVTAAAAKPKSKKVKIDGSINNLIAAARAIKTSLGDDFQKIVLGDCAEMEEVRSDLLAELLMAIADIPEDQAPQAGNDDQLNLLDEE